MGVPLLSLVSSAPAQAQEEWVFHGAAYVWLAGIEGTIGVAIADVPTDVSVGDLLTYLNVAGSGRFEVAGHRWLFLADAFYVSLGETLDAPIEGETELTIRQLIAEGTVGYELKPGLHVLGVTRYYDISQDLGELTELPGLSWVDGFVGVRYNTGLGSRWLLTLRGDVGGGGSDFSWFGQAGAGYRVGESTSVVLSYRILSVDYETGSGLDRRKYDVATNGFAVGLTFGF